MKKVNIRYHYTDAFGNKCTGSSMYTVPSVAEAKRIFALYNPTYKIIRATKVAA